MNILITGATSGIGRQLALDYVDEGHKVWAIGRNEEALSLLAEEGIQVKKVDLTDRLQALGVFATIGSIDVAILSAGTCEYVEMPHFDSALISRVMRANVESMAISIEGVLPLLRKSNQAHLVGIGSSAAYLPLPRAEAYGASKAAVAYMLETLRLDLFKEKIAVSLVCPGFVKTPLTEQNDFPMPCRITVEEASRAIRKGVARRDAEIHFPKRFTFFLKIIGFLPNYLWCRLAQKMVRV